MSPLQGCTARARRCPPVPFREVRGEVAALSVPARWPVIPGRLFPDCSPRSGGHDRPRRPGPHDRPP